MTDLKRTIARGTLGTVAAGAMALASATPAMADDYRNRDGISAGEVIAGALVIGGIAALAGAFDGDDDRYRDRRYAYNDRGHRSGYGINPRRAVNRCVRAAENQARRFGGWRYADVTQVRDVDRTRDGFRVKGRIEVQGNRAFRDKFDRGKFTCRLDGRGAPLIDFDGVRGLR